MSGAKLSHILGDILEKMKAIMTAMISHIVCLKNMAEPAVEKIIASPIKDRIITATTIPSSSLFGMMFCTFSKQVNLHDFTSDGSGYSGSMSGIFNKNKYQNLGVITRRITNK